MLLTQRMVAGVDIWVNTPRRPWEASGTSGMKVLANGGLNLSELDGWWVEAASPAVGWSLGDGKEHGDDPAWDAAEANALYDLLEHEIVPEFFARNEAGIPGKFVSRIRESMASLTPEYSASRTVRQYTEMHYLPRAEAYAARTKANNQLGRELAAWQEAIDAGWSEISFGPLRAETIDNQLRFDVPVHGGRIDADSIRVELFSQPPDAVDPEVINMERGIKLADNSFMYSATVPANRNASDFTPRVVPYHPAASVPLEGRQILWQK
jgi:starch phosphorylase